MSASAPASYTTIYKSIAYDGIRWMKIVYSLIYKNISSIQQYILSYTMFNTQSQDFAEDIVTLDVSQPSVEQVTDEGDPCPD